MKEANIKVAVRLRPLLEEEVRNGHKSDKIQLNQDQNSVTSVNDRQGGYKHSKFDYVLEMGASQKKVFDKTGIPKLIKSVVDGYHATIFAYG